MSTPPITPCIQPNPDISGIGVRVSIYAQAILSIFRLFIFAMDGKITNEEGLAMTDIMMTTELTASALLVSAIIQAKTYGLSTYHANIVLVLSWITFLPCVACVGIHSKSDKTSSDGDTTEPEANPRPKRRATWKDALGALFVCVHYSIVSGLGIWVWSDITRFGDQPECTPQTFVVIFGHNVLVTNRGLRIAALFLYGIVGFSVGVALFLIPIFAFLLLRRALHSPKSPQTRSRNTMGSTANYLNKLLDKGRIASLLYISGLEILLMASTEVLIRRSRGLVIAGESQWTFGQTLSVFLVGLSLVNAMEDFQKGYKGILEKKKKGRVSP